MAEISSYVILDLETTGLPSREFGRTKITELTMVAVCKKHLGEGSTEVPRVLNKLNLVFHPAKFIHPEAEKLTGTSRFYQDQRDNQGTFIIMERVNLKKAGPLPGGLSNDLLEEQSVFNVDSFNLLELFLARLPQPVCMIAHNGDRFDFPILFSHANCIEKSFSKDLLCADSLKAFKAIKIFDTDWNIDLNKENEVAPDITPLKPEVKKNEEASTGENTCWGPVEDTDWSLLESEVKRVEDVYPATPVGKRLVAGNLPPKLAHKSSGPRRQLFKGPSYALGNVYSHITGRPLVKAHCAEADCLGLLEVIVRLGRPFHDWVAANARTLFSIARPK